jgi:hypothetical protein
MGIKPVIKPKSEIRADESLLEMLMVARLIKTLSYKE